MPTLPNPMETNIEAPRPEAPPYNWPNHDLKNLVLLAPMSPYTRALLRIKFNCPVPDGATTFEQIEAWLATLKPPTPPLPAPQRRRNEFDLGEFILVTGVETGYCVYNRSYEKRDEIKVPLSVFEEGKRAVRDYVRDAIGDQDADDSWSDYDYAETILNDFNIEDDLDDLMERAEYMIADRDGNETQTEGTIAHPIW
jgi:hypothetical protein